MLAAVVLNSGTLLTVLVIVVLVLLALYLLRRL